MLKQRKQMAQKGSQRASETSVVLVSGFLGAGKTTVIQALLNTSLKGYRVALIENDFGDVALDAMKLAADGYTVQSLNHGCICCTLTGEFVQAIRNIVQTHAPQLLLIEPSGLGKLSDVLKWLKKANQWVPLDIIGVLTVVDVSRVALHHENFGDFFDDQIMSTEEVYLSHLDENPELAAEAKEMITRIRPDLYFVTDLDAYGARLTERIHQREIKKVDLNGSSAETTDVLEASKSVVGRFKAKKLTAVQKRQQVHKFQHKHGAESVVSHHAETDQTLQSITLSFEQPIDPEILRACFVTIERQPSWGIIRAKGITPSATGYLEWQYTPGSLKHRSTELKGHQLMFIGQQLDEEALRHCFQPCLNRAMKG